MHSSSSDFLCVLICWASWSPEVSLLLPDVSHRSWPCNRFFWYYQTVWVEEGGLYWTKWKPLYCGELPASWGLYSQEIVLANMTFKIGLQNKNWKKNWYLVIMKSLPKLFMHIVKLWQLKYGKTKQLVCYSFIELEDFLLYSHQSYMFISEYVSSTDSRVWVSGHSQEAYFPFSALFSDL